MNCPEHAMVLPKQPEMHVPAGKTDPLPIPAQVIGLPHVPRGDNPAAVAESGMRMDQ
jgi:hypothetical protein